jgi:hypothetical protein
MKIITDGFIEGILKRDTLSIRLRPDFLRRLGFTMQSPFAAVYPNSTTSGPPTTNTIQKTATETRTGTTTLTVDDTLTCTLEASKTYRIKLQVWFDTGTSADFKYDFSGPASFSLARIQHSYITPGSATITDDFDTTFNQINSVTGAGTTGGMVTADILITNGATDDTFSFRWAQNTSNADNTSVLLGSNLEVIEVE